ncbi:MAG: histidine kinase [Saprospiraceae bacterium]|nr:histidine kinase [Saprospiraceae bacterium]
MSLQLFSQDPAYISYPRLDKIDISKGLSQNVVLDMSIDPKGFLWLGTMDGLNAYDGYDFKIYRKEFKVDSSYINNFIHKVWTDKQSNVWVTKEDGAYHINTQNDSISKIFIEGEKPSKFHDAGSDSIWVSTRSQNVYKINTANHSSRLISKEIKAHVSKYQDWILSFPYATDNEFVITTVKGTIIHFKNGRLNIIENDALDVKTFNSSTYDNQGNVWLTEYNGFLYKYNINNRTFTEMSHSILGKHNYKFNCVYYDKKLNSIWISCQRSGLFMYEIKSGTTGKFMIKAPGINIIDSENIMSMVRDPYNDVMYLGTDQHGILVWDPYLYKFDFIDAERSSESSLGFRLPRKLEKDNFGNVWIGSVNTGLWQYNTSSDKLQVYTKTSHPDLLISNSSVQLYHQNDTLWVGHNGSGITKIKLPELKKLDHFYLKGKEKELDNINVIWNIIKDSKNRLWVGTRSSGIYIKEGNSVKTINKYNSILGDNIIYSIVEDPEKNIIICTQNAGLYKYSIQNESLIKVFPKAANATRYSTKTVLFDQDGFIWYATDGKGLLLLDQDYNILTSADTENGILENDAICSLILNDDNSVWASTNYGLYKLNYDAKANDIQSTMYSQSDGLTSNEFMTGAYLKTNDTLWMGNMEGVNFFKPNEIYNNPHPPRVYIKNVEINNRQTKAFGSLKQINNKDDNISFEYNTIGYTVPSKTLYSYRLMGYDTIWSKPNQRTFSRFTNLKPGKYQFQVKASNYDGKWNDEPVTLDFGIKHAIWQTLGFQIFLVLTSILFGMIIYSYRIATIKNEENLKNKYLKEITDMEMRALRAQINPHFLFNTLNSINNYILQQDGKTASHYLVKFSKLMRLILNNSTKSFISLADEMSALEIYIEMEAMRFGNSFDYFINIDKQINLDKISIPPMLLQPFVENAIWHGLMHKQGEKVLSIEITKFDETLINISITDNGIGREAASKVKDDKVKRKSYGMDITKKRIDLINQEADSDKNLNSKIEIIDLKNNDGQAKGTQVIVQIPETLIIKRRNDL